MCLVDPLPRGVVVRATRITPEDNDDWEFCAQRAQLILNPMAGTLDIVPHIDLDVRWCSQKHVNVLGEDGSRTWFEVTELVHRHMFLQGGKDVVSEEYDEDCVWDKTSTWGHFHPSEVSARDDAGTLLSVHARHFDAVYYGAVYVYTAMP